MQRSALQVVLGALVMLQEVAAGGLPRGVGPDCKFAFLRLRPIPHNRFDGGIFFG